MAFRWRADNGPTLNAGLVTLRISRSDPVLLRNSIFLWFFQGGGGGGGVRNPFPPFWIRAWDRPMYTLIEINWKPILSCASAFVGHFAYFLSHAQNFKLTKHSFLNSIRVWSGSKPFLQMKIERKRDWCMHFLPGKSKCIGRLTSRERVRGVRVCVCVRVSVFF